MATPEPNLVDICKDFVRAMNRAEQAIANAGPKLPREERKRSLEEILRWVETTDELPATGLTREVAREILGQLTAYLVYDDYRGSTDAYIV